MLEGTKGYIFSIPRTAENGPSQPFTECEALIFLDFLSYFRVAFCSVFSRWIKNY
jgi:hypothetical protein